MTTTVKSNTEPTGEVTADQLPQLPKGAATAAIHDLQARITKAYLTRDRKALDLARKQFKQLKKLLSDTQDIDNNLWDGVHSTFTPVDQREWANGVMRLRKAREGSAPKVGVVEDDDVI